MEKEQRGQVIRFPQPDIPIVGNLSRQFTTSEVSSVGREAVVFDISKKREEKPSQEHIFTDQWLAEEVARERRKAQAKGETSWYHLAGTGFFVREQVGQLLRNTQGAKEIAPDVLDLELKRVKVDTEAFEDEYLRQMLNLTWNLNWKAVDGEERVVCPDYGDALWESVTDKKERDGIVSEVLFGDREKGTVGVEDWLRSAPPDSFAVIISPSGWSGLNDAADNPIIYPESQVYAIKTLENGGLQAYTFRYDANIFQNEKLQRLLGQPVENTSTQKDRIKNVLKNVSLNRGDDPDRSIGSFEDLVDLMQESVGGREEAYQGKNFDDMRVYLKNPERFKTRHPLTPVLIDSLQTYIRSELSKGRPIEQTKKNLELAHAITILRLNRLYRDEEGKETPGKRVETAHSNRAMNYIIEQEELRKRPGCGGGGSLQITSMGLSRKGVSGGSGSQDYEFDHSGRCVSCNSGPKALGPCNICIDCDASMGGKGAKIIKSKKDVELDKAA